MTRNEIVQIAWDVGLFMRSHKFQDEPTKLEQFAERIAAAEREACAKVCEEKQTYSMPIPCPDGIEGCCVAHVVPARREKTGAECAAAIRARGEV